MTISNAAIGSTTNFTLKVEYGAPKLAMGTNTTNTFILGKPMTLPLIFSSNTVVTQIDATDFTGRFPGLVLLPKQFTNAVITGVPTEAKNATWGVELQNEDKEGGLKSAIYINVDTNTSLPSITGPVEFDFVVGVPVSRQLTADNSGNLFEKEEGDIPPGLSLSPSGSLS